jgi:8-oxo-dGTP pyrophosphatase MutT (NUDIX family)
MPPEYACALARDARGWWLLQLRPRHARHAAGLLACFGGRREGDEDAEACLRRELDEELGWRPAELAPALDLWEGGRFIARFFAVELRPPLAHLLPERGSAAVLAPTQALPGLPLSPWHARVLAAAARGEPLVDLAR